MRLAVLIVPRAPLHIRHQAWSHQEYGDSAPDQNLTARQSYGIDPILEGFQNTAASFLADMHWQGAMCTTLDGESATRHDH